MADVSPFCRPDPPPPPARKTQKSLWILDPDSKKIVVWYRFFLSSCIAALFLDPLYLFLLYIDGPLCMRVDVQLGIGLSVLRTLCDLVYLLHIAIKFRTAFIAPNSRVFGRGELVRDPHQIAVRYLKGSFFVDLAAMLPIPQILVWCVIRTVTTHNSNATLLMLIFVQYLLRLFLMWPLNARITGIVTNTAWSAWSAAAYQMLLFFLGSHVVGALYYLFSMTRQYTCWEMEWANEAGTVPMPMSSSIFMECTGLLESPEHKSWANWTNVYNNCDSKNGDASFNFGIFENILDPRVAEASLVETYFYCLWWGLQQLSSFGQNLMTSTYIWETLFAIFSSSLGLVLFAHLIGNIETYLQSVTLRLEQWRIRRKDVEEWMRHRRLPKDIQERVRQFEQYKWLATKGVDEDSILQPLPLDLRRDIQRHLCLAHVLRVPFFAEMDDRLLDAICERLISSLSTKGTYIIREGDPVNEMHFIIRGRLASSTTNGGKAGFFNSIILSPGDFCGEELLTWALMPNANDNLPLSTRTVQAIEEVEVFALRAEDLKTVAHQFKNLHSKKLQHAFRYYSHQWRTWGTCLIQAAWRRFKKRKMEKELARQESLRNVMADLDDSSYQDDTPLLVNYSGNDLQNAH